MTVRLCGFESRLRYWVVLKLTKGVSFSVLTDFADTVSGQERDEKSPILSMINHIGLLASLRHSRTYWKGLASNGVEVRALYRGTNSFQR